MMPPQSMPIGFTYDGEPLYPARPVPAGGPQPLAMLATGEPVWPVESDLVPPGQPQPFGVLSSGAFVWAVENRAVDPPAPWYRRRRVLAAAAVTAVLGLGALATGVAGEDDQRGAQQVSPQAAADEPVERTAPQSEPEEPTVAEPDAAPAGPVVDFVMPDLKGTNLQVAQNDVQDLGVFFSVSHDLRGQRAQLLDSNWQVCTQTPAAGTRVRGRADEWEGKIDFGVVRVGETCP